MKLDKLTQKHFLLSVTCVKNCWAPNAYVKLINCLAFLFFSTLQPILRIKKKTKKEKKSKVRNNYIFMALLLVCVCVMCEINSSKVYAFLSGSSTRKRVFLGDEFFSYSEFLAAM